MRIACLQFAPQVGDIDNNLNRADAVLSKANPQNLDLLVLPELAFSGYNFKSLQHISPYLEPTTAGITSLWARTTALKYECVVTAGYPEKVDITPKWPASPEYYNSAITVNKEGETIANYRKSFLYYTDETWALEGPDGFYDGEIEGLGNTAMGICKWPTKSFERMDLNPYKFESPWSAWEFAYHILHRQANLVILSMAWLTRENARSYSRAPKEPDMDTLSYWLARLEPVIRAETEGEIIVVLANRCGVEGEAVYAGTSAVLGIQGGEVKVYGILGRGERELLVVDTTKPPQAKLISERGSSKRESVSSNRDSVGSNPPRTNSTISERSAKSNLSISTTTTNGSLMGPRTPDAMSLSMDVSMDDIMTPLSPVDAKSPNVYFHPKEGRKEDDIQREILRSSIPILDEVHCAKLRSATPLKDEMDIDQLAPATPPKDKPQSGELGPIPPLKDEPLREETDAAISAMDVDDTDTDDDEVIDVHCEVLKSSIQAKFDAARPDSPVFVRPPSPKSRNASRTREPVYLEPALISHDLAQEPQIIRPPSARSGKSGRSPPHSASAVSEAHHPNWSAFGPRSDHILRRPRSMIW